MVPSFSLSLQIRQHRIILRNHSAGHEAAFVLGDNDLVGARLAHGLGVAVWPARVMIRALGLRALSVTIM